LDRDRPLEPHLKLVLELDRVEPLGGVVGSPDGPSLPFSGWIGLAGAITAALRLRESRHGDHGDRQEP
jgi:hypothetical protein